MRFLALGIINSATCEGNSAAEESALRNLLSNQEGSNFSFINIWREWTAQQTLAFLHNGRMQGILERQKQALDKDLLGKSNGINVPINQ